jgi:hypothetical protein
VEAGKAERAPVGTGWERLAAEIFNARLLVVDAPSVLPFFDGAEVILAAIESFIHRRAAILTRCELDVLREVDQGASNAQGCLSVDPWSVIAS